MNDGRPHPWPTARGHGKDGHMFDGYDTGYKSPIMLGGKKTLLILLGLTLVSIWVIDQRFATLVHPLHAAHPAVYAAFTMLTKMGDTWIIFGVLCVSALLVGIRFPAAGRALTSALIALGLAWLSAYLLKHFFSRSWPETWIYHSDGSSNPSWIHDQVDTFFSHDARLQSADFTSFPSGHTTRITAPCAVLWQRLPQARALWIALPTLTMLGLLGGDYHFVSDCLAGIMLGIIAAHGALRLAPKLHLENRREE